MLKTKPKLRYSNPEMFYCAFLYENILCFYVLQFSLKTFTNFHWLNFRKKLLRNDNKSYDKLLQL